MSAVEENETYTLEEALKWHYENVELYNRFLEKVEAFLLDILPVNKRKAYKIESRVKDSESFERKYSAKGYTNPERDMMDMAAARIIAFTKSDVDEICAIIEKEFEIDHNNSQNKSKLLSANEMGYHSVHYIGWLNESTTKVVGFRDYKGLRVEIQIRTILQHAWSDIEHGKNYKNPFALTYEEKREINLLAGVLEVVDNEFERINRKIVKTQNDKVKIIAEKIERGEHQIPIDHMSLATYFTVMYPSFPAEIFTTERNVSFLIDLLKRHDLHTIEDIHKVIIPDYIREYLQDGFSFTVLIFGIMIISDAEKFFRHTLISPWSKVDMQSINIWRKHCKNLEAIIKANNIDIINDN